jgi:Protein of unknown function (DUF1257)
VSVIFILAPVAIAAWPAFLTTVSGVAAVLGFKTIKQGMKTSTDEMQKQKGSMVQTAKEVEMELEESELVADKLKDSSTFSMVKDDVTITFFINKKNKFAMHISGKNKSTTELQVMGKQIYNKIKQQYAYTKLANELKKKGYSIAQEEVTQQGQIRIKFTKY